MPLMKYVNNRNGLKKQIWLQVQRNERNETQVSLSSSSVSGKVSLSPISATFIIHIVIHSILMS